MGGDLFVAAAVLAPIGFPFAVYFALTKLGTFDKDVHGETTWRRRR